MKIIMHSVLRIERGAALLTATLAGALLSACALDFDRADPKVRWRLMPDGATRVQMPQGIFVIRTSAESYIFEFRNIARQKFCGMLGNINGAMTIQRKTQPPACSVEGVLDANDEYLENLRRSMVTPGA